MIAVSVDLDFTLDPVDVLDEDPLACSIEDTE